MSDGTALDITLSTVSTYLHLSKRRYETIKQRNVDCIETTRSIERDCRKVCLLEAQQDRTVCKDGGHEYNRENGGRCSMSFPLCLRHAFIVTVKRI